MSAAWAPVRWMARRSAESSGREDEHGGTESSHRVPRCSLVACIPLARLHVVSSPPRVVQCMTAASVSVAA